MTSHPLIAPRRQARLMLLVLAAMPILLAVLAALAAPSSARSPGRASPTEGPGDVAAGNQATDTDGVPPAPPSTGANIPLEYFGPMASEVNKKLVGPVQLLRSGTLSRRRTTIELPLYRGELRDGRSVWCILTDTTDKSNAEALGLNHAAKLRYSEIDSAVREGRLTKRNGLVFDAGAVDFSPDRRVVPGAGANAFPPRVNEPGSVGDRNYTPLVKITNAGGHIYNAPVVAFNQRADQIRACTGGVNHNRVHDRVVKICPTANGGGTVTIRTTPIFSSRSRRSTSAWTPRSPSRPRSTRPRSRRRSPTCRWVETTRVLGGRAPVPDRQRSRGPRQPAAPGAQQRAQGQPGSAAGDRWHPDGLARLQPDVGRQPRRVDPQRDQQGLPLAPDRRVPAAWCASATSPAPAEQGADRPG